MYQQLYDLCKQKAKHIVWVFSDLQQSNLENARQCIDICMEDYHRLGCPAEQIWCLGDAVQGTDLAQLYEMTKLQENAFASLGIPLYYATGNHDYDYASFSAKQRGAAIELPFYEMVRSHSGWFTTPDMDQPYFTGSIGNFKTFFFCDHISPDNSWLSTHNSIRYGHEVYPYGQAYWDGVRSEIAAAGDHVITAAHCAFPGGNRETEILGKIQPLPRNVRLHLYGHAHIGEYSWPKQDVFRRISWIDWQDIPQIDVASFENIRGSFCRSIILHIYEDNSLGIFFRNHDAHCFTEAYFPAKDTLETDTHHAETPW